jgi:hypothetical protein
MGRQVCGNCMHPFVEELTCGCLSVREEELEAQLAKKDAEIALLREALIKATDSYEEYSQYAGEYLVEKHGVAEDLARLRAIAEDNSHG